MKTLIALKADADDIASLEFLEIDAVDLLAADQSGVYSDRLPSPDERCKSHLDIGRYREAESRLLDELTLLLRQADSINNSGAVACLSSISALYYQMGDREAGESFRKIALAAGKRQSTILHSD